MRDLWPSALSFLVTVLLAAGFAKPAPLESWDDMQVMHAWNTVPANWESIGQPPTGATINLYISVKPERENALIDALTEVSNPSHLRHVLLTAPPPVLLFTCAVSPLQIWCLPFRGTNC